MGKKYDVYKRVLDEKKYKRAIDLLGKEIYIHDGESVKHTYGKVSVFLCSTDDLKNKFYVATSALQPSVVCDLINMVNLGIMKGRFIRNNDRIELEIIEDDADLI